MSAISFEIFIIDHKIKLFYDDNIEKYEKKISILEISFDKFVPIRKYANYHYRTDESIYGGIDYPIIYGNAEKMQQ